MELKHILSTLLKWWWLIAASVIVAGVSSYLGTRAIPKTYMAHTTLMVGQALKNPDPTQSEFYTGQVLAQSYADLARRQPVIQATLDTLGLKWNWIILRDVVNGRVIPGTQLLELSVVDTDPQRAQVLADEVAHQLILQSPAGSDKQSEADRKFIQNQMDDIKANVTKAQDEIRQLDDVIAKATSARQIQDARSRQAALQSQIANWQASYAQLGNMLQRGSPNFLSVVEPAQLPFSPVGPRVTYNVLLAMAIGLVLAGSAAFLLDYMDDTLKSADDVRRAVDLRTLGSIGRIEGSDPAARLVVTRYPRSPVAETYRMLRTNLEHAGDHPPRTLMVTSSNPLEGKSLTTANLAAAIAQSGKNVILIDADMRRPTQHKIFQLDNSVGLSTVLTRGDVGLADVMQLVNVANLSIVPAGPEPDNPSELLGSKRMSDLIELLQQYGDILIFDSPPVMAVSDAAILASRLDGTLLVVDAGNTRRGALQRSKEALTSVGARLVGVVLNRFAERRHSRYYYYYSADGKRRQRRSVRSTLGRLFGRDGRSANQTESASEPRRNGQNAKEETDLEAVIQE
jgi:capsular exopolysaccharide synthesis family protein